jgi:hypothetical protein
MDAHACPTCRHDVEPAWRFCPWCAAPQRTKLVEFFAPHPAYDGDQDLALRVSRYLGPDPAERQTRFSIWHRDGSAIAAIGLDDAEAERLAGFLTTPGTPPAEPAAPAGLRDRLARHLRGA